MRSIVLDTGAFVAAERWSKELGVILTAAAATNAPIYIPVTVVAEAWRSPAPANAAKLVDAAFEVAPLDLDTAQIVGALMGKAGTYQVVDAAVAWTALKLKPSIVFTADPDDIVRLLRAAGATVRAHPPGRAPADVIVERI